MSLPELKPFDMPLTGIRLIEASAGTGKTYNITSLYLRLLLDKGLSVDAILVVTFTRAATEELRDRIRGRIQTALNLLEGRLQREADEVLYDWLQQRDQHEADKHRLRVALVSMDEAAVFTIHGFCQRVLGDNAFETGVPFQLEFIENEDALRQQAAEDFWRHWFAQDNLVEAVAEKILKAFADGPRAVAKKVALRLHDDHVQVVPDLEAGSQQGDLMSSLVELHKKYQNEWREHGEQIRELLETARQINRRSYNKSVVAATLAAAEEVAKSKEPVLDLPKYFDRLSASMLANKGTKEGETPVSHSFFDLCQQYMQRLQQIVPLFQQQARAFIREHVARAKVRRQQLYFDDLLKRLDAALRGKNGGHLAGQLRQQYPQAMIDEFQDTDAVQYRIFRTIYGRDESERTGLYLIGDPKQAIYGFRGGDIFTYLAAARDARDKYSLGTNWRSSSRLVEGVNTLFGHRPGVFLQEGIDYQEVKPSPIADKEPLKVNGKEPVPLQFWRLDAAEQNSKGKILMNDAQEAAAVACANHIAGLLQSGKATLGERPLLAGDIALLVRRHSDVQPLQKALQARGIRSVSLADESVYHSEEAAALQMLLQAVVNAEDERLLRFVLADRLLGYSAAQIQKLLEHDDDWEQLQQRFFAYRELWRERGFIQAFSRLFRQEKIASRLLALPDGRRRLTNLLQLVELLQQASRTRPGLESLLRWLADERALAGKHEEARLRLESDEELVKILTIHASKGLEYPVVYIPFPWVTVKPKDQPWFFHDKDGQPCLYFGGADKAEEEAIKAACELETQAENMRLLYVAITRAAKLCVLPWGEINSADQSALAWLLRPGDNGGVGAEAKGGVFAHIQALVDRAPEAIALCDAPQETPSLAPGPVDKSLVQVRPFTAHVERTWRVNSYSGLIRGQPDDHPDHDAILPATMATTSAMQGIQALPAGPDFGVLVHELLEELDFTTVNNETLKARVEALAWRHGLAELRTDAGMQAMLAMIHSVLKTDLPPAGLRLEQLDSPRRVDEMEFHFSLTTLTPRKLERLLADFPDWQAAARGLNFPAFKGLMHGYIDLVFEWNGRYWLADYKSNRLDDYGEAGLAEAMAVHRYPLQALIYSLALHRHLHQTLPDYDPARHFGGVFYLFTRGMRPGSNNGIWFRALEPRLLEVLDNGFGGRSAA